jgi:hypothetical protein
MADDKKHAFTVSPDKLVSMYVRQERRPHPTIPGVEEIHFVKISKEEFDKNNSDK